MARSETPSGELSAMDVCRLLQPIFPHRVVSAAILHHWKKRGIEPRGKVVTRGRKRYTFDDVLTLAACFELKDLGVQATAFPSLVNALRQGGLGSLTIVGGQSESATVLYDVGEMRKRVLAAWEAAVK